MWKVIGFYHYTLMDISLGSGVEDYQRYSNIQKQNQVAVH